MKKRLYKLRISNHNLMIERGRYPSPNTPREERLCHSYSSHLVEDDLHFRYVCSIYDKYRKDLFFKLSQGKDISSLPDSQKVDSMFNSTNADVLYIYIYIYIYIYMKKGHPNKANIFLLLTHTHSLSFSLSLYFFCSSSGLVYRSTVLYGKVTGRS